MTTAALASNAASADAVLAALDPEQREVATALRGPVCILAGAGTGKTRAITHRIAYAVHSGVFGRQQVLAVTFTARAAGELRARLRPSAWQASRPGRSTPRHCASCRTSGRDRRWRRTAAVHGAQGSNSSPTRRRGVASDGRTRPRCATSRPRSSGPRSATSRPRRLRAAADARGSYVPAELTAADPSRRISAPTRTVKR